MDWDNILPSIFLIKNFDSGYVKELSILNSKKTINLVKWANDLNKYFSKEDTTDGK